MNSKLHNEVKIDSPLVKITLSGQIMCIVCNVPVKSTKIWTAHVNSRKHIENVSQAKMKRISTGQVSDNRICEKRPSKPIETNPSKKLRTIADQDMPIDFFDSNSPQNEESHTEIITPWQAESDEKQLIRKPQEPKANSTAALPEGFFDDPKQDRKVRNAPDPNERMDEEYAKFQKEMQQVEQQRLENALEETELEIIEKDMQDIDTQISEWTRVNLLEKKKEDVFSIAQKARKALNLEKKFAKIEDEDDDINLDDIFDWRIKSL